MSEYLIKLGAALPKGDPNGFADDDLATELWRAKIEGRNVQPRVAVIVYDVAEAKVDKNGDHVVTVRVRRAQPVDSLTNRRALEDVLRSEYREQTGAHTLPFEVDSVTKAAFVDLPKTDEEIDALEADEQDNMSPTDELRRHLERVHGIQDAHLLTPEDADAKHAADHDGDMPEVLAHDREWLGWTRADLEQAQAESEDLAAEDTPELKALLAGGEMEVEESGAGAGDTDELTPEESSDPEQTDGQIPGVAFSGSRE